MTKVDRDKWPLALRMLTDALQMLDESGAPLEIGAEIDLAIHRLQAAVDRKGAEPLRSVTQTPARSNN